MMIVSKIVLVIAIAYTIWQLIDVRRKVRNSEIVLPPFLASTLFFSLFIKAWVSGLHSSHLCPLKDFTTTPFTKTSLVKAAFEARSGRKG